MLRGPILGISAVLLLLGAGGLAGQADAEGDTTAGAFADAFLDAQARALLGGVRERHARLDTSIASYSTVVTERFSIRLRALWRDRLLFRREMALRLHWRRDGPSRVEALGARQVAPIATTDVEVPDRGDIMGSAGDLLFHPGRARLLMGFDDDDALRLKHPLSPDAEAHYRYETGDTLTVRLPEGRTVRLIELRVHPRRDDFDLIAGSFWLDAESHDVVRAIYRPARPFDLFRDIATLDRDDEGEEGDSTDTGGRVRTDAGEPDGREEEDDDIGWIPGPLRPIRAELKRVVVEYGLWEMKWWLPRLVSIEMTASAGNFVHTPASYERAYSAYDVDEVVSAPDSGRAAVPTVSNGTLEACPEWIQDYDDESPDAAARDSVGGRDGRARPDSVAVGPPSRTDSSAAEPPPLEDGERWGCRCEEEDGCELYIVGALPDSMSLRTSELLPPSIFESGETVLTEGELEEFGRIVEALPRSEDRWTPPRTEFAWGLRAPGLVRYNRIEGLSIGARLDADFGRAKLDLTARLGTADREPNAELGAESGYYAPGVRLAAYRRLDAANHGHGALGLGNSFFAFAFGLDDGDYYRALGVEVTRPADAALSALDWRLFAERHSAAVTSTDFSLRRLLGGGHTFRGNFTAADAEQIGAEATLRHSRGLDTEGFRWGAWTRARGAVGTFDYGRGAAGLWTTVPLPGKFIGALEAEAGGSVGRVPAQSLWRLGGPGSLRGFGGSAAVGEAFWRARAELATEFPGARMAIFGDAAWAGPRADWGTGRPLLGVGAGASVLDGIIRVDLARALNGPESWRFAIYLGGLL